MRISERLDTVDVSKNHVHRYENMIILMSAVGFLSMASIYLLFN